MKKMIFLVVVVAGVWWYASKRFNFKDTLLVAKKYQSSSWAPTAVYSVGLVYYQRGDYEMSKQAFSQLLADYPTGQYAPQALLRLSEVAEETRDYELARASLKRFVEEYPQHSGRQIAQKRLELLMNR
ncbi:MAG: tetratricopeptide repeat protein [Elusimicrobiota bacterium]